MMNPTYTVYIDGGASGVRAIDVIDYVLLDLKAATYHKLIFSGNRILYLNDFGIRCVTVVPKGTKEYDIPRF